jgi:hypothetical protein
MSSNATTTTNNVATLTSHPKAQTAKKVIAANVIEQLEAGGARNLLGERVIHRQKTRVSHFFVTPFCLEVLPLRQLWRILIVH